MKKEYLLGIIGIFLLVTIANVSAFGFGKMPYGLTEDQREELINQHQQIQKAIENNDYNSWKELMEKRVEYIKKQINEETFNLLRDYHNKRVSLRNEIQKAKEEGNFSKFVELKQKQNSFTSKRKFSFFKIF
ncbi:MAG: hypothetical protein QW273_02205 [Candidatus Pacearchaeota archaeon]